MKPRNYTSYVFSDSPKLRELTTLSRRESSFLEFLRMGPDSHLDQPAASEQGIHSSIKLYLWALRKARGDFGDSPALKRALRYMVGHAFEYLGTYALEGADPLKRANALERAAAWYRSADDAVGAWTDYALRQVQSCWGVSFFRNQAGLSDSKAIWYTNYGNQLLSNLLSFSDKIIIVSGRVPLDGKMFADKTLNGVVKMYIHRLPHRPETN
ncbi:MAG: hypothetical protein KGH94_00715 [Candidatus Micrarchaeota archaeon]|nr:hypothetical protein [Candidatus Micrarchaeota archaeon]